MRSKQRADVAPPLLFMVMPLVILKRNLAKDMCQFLSSISLSPASDSDGKLEGPKEVRLKAAEAVRGLMMGFSKFTCILE